MSMAALCREAVTALLSDYGVDGTPVTTVAPAREATSCGILGFTGDSVRGCVVLVASPEVLARTWPLAGQPSGDWPGELVNQLVGRLKKLLLERGVEVSVSTPIVLRGFEIAPVTSREGLRLVTADGWVEVWVDVSFAPGFALGEAVEDAAHLCVGDAILF